MLGRDAQKRGRLVLSTRQLEPTPGDMLVDPQLVYDKAEEMGEAFRAHVAKSQEHARRA